MKFKATVATCGDDAFGYSYPQAVMGRMAEGLPGASVSLDGREVGTVESAEATPYRVTVWGEIAADVAGLYAVPVWMDLEVVGLILVPVPSDPNLTPVEMME